jgi:hypothetical protein
MVLVATFHMYVVGVFLEQQEHRAHTVHREQRELAARAEGRDSSELPS